MTRFGAPKPGRTPGSSRAPKPAKTRAIGLLARREYSRVELSAKLVAGGATRDEVEPLMDELAALGYLSDDRFARAVVRQKSGGYSRRAIAATLKASGVPAETTADAVAGSEIDDGDALVALWRRRFGRAPADDREKARQVRFLQSRGFSLSAIFRLLRNPPQDDGAEGG
ncbi:MAG: regulatory protein RecX [Betaproteobacteria bacterium]